MPKYAPLAWLPLMWLASAAGSAQQVDFSHDILPLLKERCAECHTAGKHRGGLSMDTRDALLESGVVEPGQATDSELIARVTSEDLDVRMPPEGEALSAEQVDALRRWIDGGLAWEPGFSFTAAQPARPLAPRRPTLPDGPGNPIDRLVGAYFAEHDIAAPPPIDDGQFYRRASLDLVGLLPSPEDLAALSASDRTGKRGALIDQLLQRNADYADHWLTFWNDLLRNDYAGTGYIDGGRTQITGWLYQALYENRPYDQFVRELIDPDDSARGFIRGIKWRGKVNSSQRPEVQFAQNVSQVFLGENLKCASCHDSFINDWKLADAYGMAAIVAEGPLEIYRCDKPTGEVAQSRFLWPELGAMDPQAPPDARLRRAAELITHPDNGRFTRTIVNRLWQRLMGRGLVEPVDMMGLPAWDPDLLDFLAADFADHGYDLKHTLQLIATSRIYQAACMTQRAPEHGEAFQFRGPIARRLTAEQFVDALWALTDTGPQVAAAKIELPAAATRQNQFVRASLVVSDPLMRALGRPNREQVVTTRPDELSTLQALQLTNDQQVYDRLRQGAARWLVRYPEGDALVSAFYQATLCRVPTVLERQAAAGALGPEPSSAAVADFFWSVLMLPEFQHVR